ncbi:PilW family protein [Sporosarcina sp. FSL W7-1283]|uniref:PilW family protein n=1 Tax=Sporosarcina sp. FSL W7-1283 TaxID=2921560 RepID=UPI0030F76896
MRKKEKGMILVEVLATLVLLSLIVGIIWTTYFIASKSNVKEMSVLRLQKEANYIISELQQVHRHCPSYELTIAKGKIEIRKCTSNDNQEAYNGIISSEFRYFATFTEVSDEELGGLIASGFKDFEGITDNEVIPTGTDLNFLHFIVQDPLNTKRYVDVPTLITRYKTD